MARSSRNERLSEAERTDALALSEALAACDALWREGERDAEALSRALSRPLEAAPGVQLDYAAVRGAERWTGEDPSGPMESCVALVAARVGPVRLIDNLVLGEGEACEISLGAGSGA